MGNSKSQTGSCVSFSIGLDIGGTKIAGAIFDKYGKEVAQKILPTPADYSALVTTSMQILAELEGKGDKASVGIGVPGPVERGTVAAAVNIPALIGKPIKADLEKALGRSVAMANDADCAALSEAIDGAGKGFANVFGLIMGTGVGGGLVVNGKIVQGANGLTGEFGQLPLPFREASDGPLVDCPCGQKGCINKTISGSGLARLYQSMTGKEADAEKISAAARTKDADALRVLDQFYTTVAKAMITVLHTYDPDVIVVSGGLNQLPGLYDEVPKRWERFAMRKNLVTKFVPAKHGAMSGLRGAAWLGKSTS
ncbi:MAG TPA: ROK family protein [Alphaproteobacteria bacterium]|nr:ROK family protein [Alphaproteobacteria bacterium]